MIQRSLSSQSKIPEVTNRNFEITNDNIEGRTIKDLDIRMMTKANISRIMSPNTMSVAPTAEAILHKGDVVKAVGTEEALKRYMDMHDFLIQGEKKTEPF